MIFGLVPYHARKLLALKKVNEWLRRVREGASYYYYLLLLYLYHNACRDATTRNDTMLAGAVIRCRQQ